MDLVRFFSLSACFAVCRGGNAQHDRSYSVYSAAKTPALVAGNPGNQKFAVWPEWSDADLLNEKWEGVPSKSKEKRDDKKPQAAVTIACIQHSLAFISTFYATGNCP